jgi:hypothetical protein
VTERGDDLMIDVVSYDLRTERTHTERITVRGGRVWRAAFSVRLYGFIELARLLAAAGFSNLEGFGRNGGPLTLYGRRLIVVGEKADTRAPGRAA